jgi:hypothetical protein
MQRSIKYLEGKGSDFAQEGSDSSRLPFSFSINSALHSGLAELCGKADKLKPPQNPCQCYLQEKLCKLLNFTGLAIPGLRV